MRMILFATVLIAVTIPTIAVALAFSVTGNKPQPPANYKRWPGLVDVVNQPSRQQLAWCNGAESLFYAGDSDALNSTLQRFAEIQCPTHTVVLRPGPLHDKYDWKLDIVEGIARAGIERYKTQLVRGLDPTLVVYVSDKLKLDSVVIPPGVRLQQLSDLRLRYLNTETNGNDATKRKAAAYLKAIDEDPVLEGLGKAKYETQIQRITAFIQRLAKER